MPFIPQDERRIVKDIPITDRTCGQRCYLHYKWMKERWNKSPRWTTVDDIYEYVKTPQAYTHSVHDKEQRAKELAWQVFFVLVVAPYEQKKLKENGDI